MSARDRMRAALACLLAASLLQRAERDDLADLVLRGLGSGP